MRNRDLTDPPKKQFAALLEATGAIIVNNTELCPRCLIPMRRIAGSEYVGYECEQCGMEAFSLIEEIEKEASGE